MKATLLLICIITSFTNISATDIFAEQSWELIKDANLNGWVDEGDIIRNTVEVTVYSKKTESLRIVNHHSAYFNLIPGTVTTQSGNVIMGNNPSDGMIEVADIKIARPWGITQVSYDSEVTNLSSLIDGPLTNYATVYHASGAFNTNEINIPLLSQFVKASTNTSIVYSSTFRLLILLFLGLVIGVWSKRISIPRFSLD